jgi:hypothetical protein
LEAEGKLDEALDRYFSALRADSHLGEFPGSHLDRADDAGRAFSQIANWAAQKGQTAERIDAALDRLRGIDSSVLHLDENLKWDYVFARRLVLGDDRAMFYSDSTNQHSIGSEIFWGRLMPWERQRGLRMLNLLTATALDRLQIMRRAIAERTGVVRYLVPDYSDSNSAGFFDAAYNVFESPERREKADWLWTTHPDLQRIGFWGILAASALAEFETSQRATMLRLAIESYRLKHGALPRSLAELVGPYFREMPLDPYSGLEFRYFPAGLERFVPGVPCIWSTGASLWVNQLPPDRDEPAVGGTLQYGLRHYSNHTDPDVVFWARGFWFPIPEQRR